MTDETEPRPQGWKQDIAHKASQAIDHSLVVNTALELCSNLGIPFDGLTAYGLNKLAHAAASVAIAQAAGIDADELRLDPAERLLATLNAQQVARAFGIDADKQKWT